MMRMEVVSLEMWSKSSGSKIVVNTTDREELVAESDKENTIKSILLVKDKYSNLGLWWRGVYSSQLFLAFRFRDCT